MLIELSSGRVRLQGASTFTDGRGATLHFPSECEERLGLAEGVSVEDAESRCFLRRIPCAKQADGRVTITSDYMGMRHLYVRERHDAGELQVTIADDPFAFRGVLEPDLDVLRLLPALKFAPLPLSCVSGTTRMLPGTSRTYRLDPLALAAERNLIPELLAPEAHADEAALPGLLQRIVEEERAGAGAAHVFLSGGMDSALITALLRSQGVDVQAWTATFGSSLGKLEGERARASAAFLGARIDVRDVDEEGRRTLGPILDAMLEPFADVAMIAEAVLARQASAAGARKVFEGEGVDSLMGGSYKFVVEYHRRSIRWASAVLPDLLLTRANRSSAWGRTKLKLRQLKSLVRDQGTPFERHLAFLAARPAWDEVGRDLRARVEDVFRRYHDQFVGLEPLNRLAAMTFWGNIPNLENRKLDVVQRYSGVQFLLPFQDARFIRTALAMPASRKVRFGYGKWCMRRAFRRTLPPHTLTRKKLSFVPQVLDLLGPEQIETLRDPALFGDGVAERMLQEHRSGARDHLATLWAMYVANHWLRRYRTGQPGGGNA